MNGDLAELEAITGGMLKALEPRERRRLFRRVATAMRKQNRARIRKQRNPDGSRFAPRKPAPEPIIGNYAVKFLYPSSGSGAPRLAFMKSWEKQGPIFTGYDIEAGGLRSFEYAKVIKWLPVSVKDENTSAGTIRRRRTIRQRAMFRKITRRMFTGQSDHEAWIGFGGMVASVAEVHQFGLRDRPARHAREVRYARRELLGMTAADREDLLDAVLEHLTEKV
ncbi:phage virion morphogenesis protein [Altererythrobacter endophyticus]|uniref:Phage virion morphogenesis protein n=1 Tax=Altericroceibacterium endophyticum TaxID=1808508 RepID=A0A6I4T8A5_9SPHN|nr:phage virion morphogenesis protein [Altericroceibacterium endophyticum]